MAGVWYVEDSDLPGVNAWAPTVQELSEKLPAVVLDLLEEQGDGDLDDVPIEIIAHMSTRVRRAAATWTLEGLRQTSSQDPGVA